MSYFISRSRIANMLPGFPQSMDGNTNCLNCHPCWSSETTVLYSNRLIRAPGSSIS